MQHNMLRNLQRKLKHSMHCKLRLKPKHSMICKLQLKSKHSIHCKLRLKLIAVRVLLSLLLLLLLSGCWNTNDIQDFLYATALGIDYVDDQYIVYVQFEDFENLSVAGAGTGKALAGNYVGRGAGITLIDAVTSIYPSAQAKVEWRHLKSIVVSERAIALLDSKVIKQIYRFPDNRYNIWLYVTKEPIDQIFKMSSLFNATSLFTILHSPISSFEQKATIPPLLTFKYMLTTSEPDRLVCVPLIGINNSRWESEREKQPMLEIKGAFFNTPAKKGVTLTQDELTGFKWLNPQMKRIYLVVKNEENIYSTITIVKKKIKVKPFIEGGQVRFNIKADFVALMNEYNKELGYEKMVSLAEQNIKDEIKQVYATGLEKEVDLLNLMHHFRLKMPKQWKQMTSIGEEFILTDNSIQDLQIKVIITYNGKYKRRM